MQWNLKYESELSGRYFIYLQNLKRNFKIKLTTQVTVFAKNCTLLSCLEALIAVVVGFHSGVASVFQLGILL